MDDEDWMHSDPPPKAFSRKNKLKLVVGLDDLLAEQQIARENPLVEAKPKKKPRYLISDDEDEEEEVGDHRMLEKYIDQCGDEVGDGSDMVEPPKWGEIVFGPQKKAPECREPEIFKTMVTAAASMSSFSDVAEGDMSRLISGNWILPLAKGDPVVQEWIFHTMAYTKDRHVERSACKILCELSVSNDPGIWRPTSGRVLEAFCTYGYDGNVSSASPASGTSGPFGPPPNIISLLDFVRCCYEKRHLKLFSASDSVELLRVLARCSLDRRMLALSCSIQDCIEAVIDYFGDEEWDASVQQFATCLARFNGDPINILHVTKKLRGTRLRVEQLQREIAFQLLSTMASENLKRCPEDIISKLKVMDPRVPDVDFVELLHVLNLADLWLRYEANFRNEATAFECWMGVLKNLAVRISCGDYRTFATKVRNRAAFLMSMYSNLTIE